MDEIDVQNALGTLTWFYVQISVPIIEETPSYYTFHFTTKATDEDHAYDKCYDHLMIHSTHIRVTATGKMTYPRHIESLPRKEILYPQGTIEVD